MGLMHRRRTYIFFLFPLFFYHTNEVKSARFGHVKTSRDIGNQEPKNLNNVSGIELARIVKKIFGFIVQMSCPNLANIEK